MEDVEEPVPVEDAPSSPADANGASQGQEIPSEPQETAPSESETDPQPPAEAAPVETPEEVAKHRFDEVLKQEPRCKGKHALKELSEPLKDGACASCWASPVVAACPSCTDNNAFGLCADCFRTGKILFTVTLSPQGNPYQGLKWTGRFHLNVKDAKWDGGRQMFACDAIGFRHNVFSMWQAGHVTVFIHPDDLEFTRMCVVTSFTSGVDSRFGESNRIGVNGGGLGDDIMGEPYFGWLNKDHYIEGGGDYQISRVRVQDLEVKKPTLKDIAVSRVQDALRDRAIQSFALMNQAAGKKDKEKQEAMDPKTLTKPTLAAKPYLRRLARERTEYKIKDVFKKHKHDWEEFKFGSARCGVKLDMEDIIYCARLIYTSYLTSRTEIYECLDQHTVQQYVDPRWEALEKEVLGGKTLQQTDVPDDLLDKFNEYFWLKFLLTFFDQRRGEVETFGMTRPLVGAHNALKMVELAIDGDELARDLSHGPIIVGNVELFVARAWWSNGEGVISFQGTTTLSDNITNFSGELVPFNPFEDQSGKPLKSLKSGEPGVHEGYYKAFLSIRDAMMKNVEETIARFLASYGAERDNFRLIVCGHSMGGALAAMTAVYLAEWYDRQPKEKLPRNMRIMVQTYGQPKIGNLAFVQKYERHHLFRRVGTMANDVSPLKKGEQVFIVDSTSKAKVWKVIGEAGTEVGVPSEAIEFLSKTRDRPRIRILRFFDLNDPIPTFPPLSLGYHHLIGESCACDSDGNMVFIPPRLSKKFDTSTTGLYRALMNRWHGFSLLSNHVATAYMYKVVKFVAKQGKGDPEYMEERFSDHQYYSRMNDTLKDLW